MGTSLARHLLPLTAVLGLVLACGDGPDGVGGGAAGNGGSDGVVSPCEANVCPCTEEGVLGALEEGGGPFTFSCDGPTVITTSDELIVRRDVILDGQRMLTLDGGDAHRVLSVFEGTDAELRNMTISRGRATEQNARGENGGGIFNVGTLLLQGILITECTATRGSGIYTAATLTMKQTTIATNRDEGIGGALHAAGGDATITNSTIANNAAYGLYARCSSLRVAHTTLSGNGEAEIRFESGCQNEAEFVANIVSGRCGSALGRVESKGYNIESPADTCGFRRAADLNGVEPGRLDLQPLAESSGRLTMALGSESIAVDRVDVSACTETVDQRGVERPQGSTCDAGAYELEVP